MNIYQHLFFIIPSAILIILGTVGERKTNYGTNSHLLSMIMSSVGLAGFVLWFIITFILWAVPFFIYLGRL